MATIEDGGYSSSNYCVCCGAEIPEGLQVCPNCIGKLEDVPVSDY